MDSLTKTNKRTEKNMRQLIVLVTLLFATASYAEEITIVPAGKPGGSSFTRATMYQEVLKKNGHSVKFENISAMTEATKYLEKTRGKENVIIMFASNQPAQMGYFITKKNFVLREYSAPYYWCMSNEAKGKDKLIVGLDKNMNQKFSDAVFKKLGKEVVYLRYKNSGALYNAITGGDIDAMFTNQGKSLKLVGNNLGSCIANTSKETMHGVKSVYTIVDNGLAFPVMDYPIISNNTSDEFRELLLETNKDSVFKSWRQKRKLTEIVGALPRKEELKIVEEGQHNWK